MEAANWFRTVSYKYIAEIKLCGTLNPNARTALVVAIWAIPVCCTIRSYPHVGLTTPEAYLHNRGAYYDCHQFDRPAQEGPHIVYHPSIPGWNSVFFDHLL